MLGVAIFFGCILMAIVIFVYNGITFSETLKKGTREKQKYSEKEKVEQTRKFAIEISIGISIIIGGVVLLICLGENIPSNYSVSLFMVIIAIAVYIFTYSGIIYLINEKNK